MPDQYTFNEFSPREFEFLCRDLIQRKITEEVGKPFFFNSPSEGADEGVDAIFEDKTQKIILQCKRYKNFKELWYTLKNYELPKVIKLNPTRYIIATSCDLHRDKIDKIYNLFKPYMQSTDDVLGQLMINNLLAAYPDIELNYPRLYLNSAAVLNRIFQANVYNQSKDKLEKYQKLSRFYVNDGSLEQALKILEDKRYVIISGEPGVGKSTLAGMLSLYYLKQDHEFIFLRKSVSEGEGSVWKAEEKQLFFFDDFLGSTNFEGFDRNEDRQLLDFIKKVVVSPNKLLLITTREYVFKQAEEKYPELKKLQFTKCMIRQKGFTSAFKIGILYNYLYYSDIELKHIQPLLYDEHYEAIIHHRNFTPRLIDDYIERYYNRNDSSYSLYVDLNKYLDNPYAYWEEVFIRLNHNAQILLLIMAITEEPAIEDLIYETFVNVGKYRKIYEQGYEVDSFNEAIAELSESFISISHNSEMEIGDGSISSMDYSLLHTSFRTSKYLEFQNPSIKDFAVNYLRKREDINRFLLHGATLFNQLTFVFTTLKDDKRIEDHDADLPYTVGKIILPPHLCNVVAEKMMSEFDTLPIAKVKRINWSSGKSSFHLNEDRFDNRMEKLWSLCRYFPLDNHKEVQKFVIEIYKQLLNEDKVARRDSNPDKEHTSLSLEERLSQINVIHKLHHFIQLDPLQTVKDFYLNIRFAKEYLSLHSLQEIFPDAYHEVVTTNIKEIRREIKEIIYDDIDYYLWEGTQKSEEAIDELIDIDLEELKEIYKFKLSKKLMLDINEISGRELFRISQVKKESENFDRETKGVLTREAPNNHEIDGQKYEGYKVALQRLPPQWIEAWDEDAAYQYIRAQINNDAVTALLIKRIENNRYYSDLLDNHQSVDLLLSYLNEHKDEPDDEYTFYEQIFNAGQFDSVQLNHLQKAAYALYINDLFVFRKETFENLKWFKEVGNLSAIGIDKYNSLLEQQDIWFRFLSPTFHVFFVVKHIMSLSEEKRIGIYKSFKEENVYYENHETLWKFCYEVDKDLFYNYFILLVIQNEVDTIFKDNENDMVVSFLRKHNLSYDFSLRKEEQHFDLWSGGGGDPLVEDIASTFEELNITSPFWLIEDCFNLSRITNTSVRQYIEKYCPVADGRYEIKISKELYNREFIKLLKPAGVNKKVLDYITSLKKIIS